jgi:hypothetical protein
LGLLLQQLRCARAQVSAFVRTDAQNVAGSASAFERNTGVFERITALRSWNRLSAGTRLFWNRWQCVRAQDLRSTALSAPDFPETRNRNEKYQNKNYSNFFFFLIFLDFFYTKARNK